MRPPFHKNVFRRNRDEEFTSLLLQCNQFHSSQNGVSCGPFSHFTGNSCILLNSWQQQLIFIFIYFILFFYFMGLWEIWLLLVDQWGVKLHQVHCEGVGTFQINTPIPEIQLLFGGFICWIQGMLYLQAGKNKKLKLWVHDFKLEFYILCPL